MGIKKHIPNIISTIRLLMALSMVVGIAPFIPAIFVPVSYFTITYFLIGGLTDFIDGILARKWKVKSRYGEFVDPLADKLFNGVTLLFIGALINPLTFVSAGIEVLIAIVNEKRRENNKESKVLKIGKVKTGALFFTIPMLIMSPLSPIVDMISKLLLFTSMTFQGATIYAYLKQYSKEITENTIDTKREIIIHNNEVSDETKKKIIDKTKDEENVSKRKKLKDELEQLKNKLIEFKNNIDTPKKKRK